MSSTDFTRHFLARLLPAYLGRPAPWPEAFELPEEIGLLSRPRAGYIPYRLPQGCRWLDQAPEETDILHSSSWQDIHEFYQLLRSAALAGCNDALNDLGWLGLNFPALYPDLTNRLLRIAAQRGSPEALYNLAEQYFHGRHLTPCLSQALSHYQLASPMMPEATVRLGRLCQRGHYLHPSLPLSTRAERQWFEKGHQAGYSWATYYLSLYWLRHPGHHAAKDVWLDRLEELAMEGDLPISFSASFALAMHYPHWSIEHDIWMVFSDRMASALDHHDENRRGHFPKPHLVLNRPAPIQEDLPSHIS